MCVGVCVGVHVICSDCRGFFLSNSSSGSFVAFNKTGLICLLTFLSTAVSKVTINSISDPSNLSYS